MSKNHSYSKPPQPQKYRHTPITRGDYEPRSNRAPLVFFIAFVTLLALAAMSH